MAESDSVGEQWTPNQRKLIRWLAAPESLRDPRTHGEFADSIGVGESTLYRWKRLPELSRTVGEEVRENLQDDLPEIYQALKRQAKRGSYQHIKLALELAEHYVERKEVTGRDGAPIVHRLVIEDQPTQEGGD